mgnify:CR=1 FL=1
MQSEQVSSGGVGSSEGTTDARMLEELQVPRLCVPTSATPTRAVPRQLVLEVVHRRPDVREHVRHEAWVLPRDVAHLGHQLKARSGFLEPTLYGVARPLSATLSLPPCVVPGASPGCAQRRALRSCSHRQPTSATSGRHLRCTPPCRPCGAAGRAPQALPAWPAGGYTDAGTPTEVQSIHAV